MLTRYKHPISLLIGSIVLASLVGIVIHPLPASGQSGEEGDENSLSSALAPFLRVLEYLNMFYYRDVSLPELVEGAIQGALRVLEDPHTAYYKPSQFEDVQIDIDGNYTGVGMTLVEQEDYVTIQSVFPGSPAERAGLLPGDKILAINGERVDKERPDRAAQLIRGPEGTTVTITVQRGDNDPFQVDIVRERIFLQAVDAHVVADDIGYIRIVQFYENTGEQVRAAYNRLAGLGVRGIVLDLRNNPGGIFREAVAVSRVFVDDGPIVHVVDYSGNKQTYYGLGRRGEPALPVAVLVNHGTASAAEIVAAAIRDNGVGKLVGSRTYGKGTVQSIFELGNGSALKLTTAEYLTPMGESLEGLGLEPDVYVNGSGPEGADPADEPDFAPLSGRFVLQRGSRGLEVEGLQQRLNYIGFDAGPVDGIFGSLTEAALKAFQREWGLPVTGRYDAVTHQLLGEAIMKRWRGGSGSTSNIGGIRDNAIDDPVLERALQLLQAGVLALPAAGGQ